MTEFYPAEIVPDREYSVVVCLFLNKYSRSVISVEFSAELCTIFPIGDVHNYMTTKQLGSIIRESRVSQSLRQEQLAAATGVGLRFLVELEAGKPTAQLGKALAVLDALGCRVTVDCPSALSDRA